MKKSAKITIGFFIGAFIAFLLAFMLFVKSCADLNRSIGDLQKKAELNIGKKIIINKDTLLIVNYSSVYGYKLSNGITISPKLLEKLLVIK